MYKASSVSEADKGMSSSSSSCLGRAAVPVKRVWRGLSSRLSRRRRTTYVPVNPDHDDRSDDDGVAGVGSVLAGLGRLRKEVRTCEYHDVHVMWEMLSSNGNGAVIGRGGIRDHMADDDVTAPVAGKAAPPKRRRGRKPGAPWSRVVTYCCGAF